MRRPPFLRLLLLAVVVLAGVGLFLTLSLRTAPVVTPSEMTSEP